MKLHHVALTVKNLEESRRFYEEYFSAKIVKEFTRPDLKGKAVFLEFDNVHIELWEFKDRKENKDSLNDLKILGIRHIAFEVENVDKASAELRAKGLIISEPQLGGSGHRYAFTQDPNGIQIELYEK